MRSCTASKALICVLALAPVPGFAVDEPSVELSFGALSDDYLGRPAWSQGIGQDGVAFGLSHRIDRLQFDVTFAQGFDQPVDAVPTFDLGLWFAQDTWKVGVGKVERHWSPSRYNSLILSRNAQAFPSAYIAKTRATQSDLALFSWLGPWSGEVFVGETSDPNQPDGALLAGMRFSFEPAPGLELDLVRTVQFGGDSQPAPLRTLAQVLVGGSNEGAAANANQMAGIGVSYRFGGPSSTRLYAQVIGEDEAGGLPSCLFYLAGIETQGRMFGADTTVTLETVDTRIDTTQNGFCGPNTAYNNNTYPYRHKGRVIGAAIGSESRSADLRVEHKFDSWSLGWGVGYYEINDASDPDHLLSSTRSTGPMASIEASADIAGGTVNGVMIYQGFNLDRADQDKGLRIGLGFSKSF